MSDNLNTQFPTTPTTYLKASDFQDIETNLTFLGWEKRANEDRTNKDGTVVKSWKDCLDYCLKYSYPEFAVDRAGEPMLDDNGDPRRNSNWDEKYPHGYSILYHFEEGQLDSGSMPLFRTFSRVQPKPGEKLVVKRTGEKTETTWLICRESDRASQAVPEKDVDEFGASTKAPF